MPSLAQLQARQQQLLRTQQDEPPAGLIDVETGSPEPVAQEPRASVKERMRRFNIQQRADGLKRGINLRVRPGLLERKQESLGSSLERIIDEAIVGAKEGFQPDLPFADIPTGGAELLGLPEGTPAVDPLVRGASEAGALALTGVEGALRGLGAGYIGSLRAFRQTLVEFGVDDTTAKRLTRDMAAFGEVSSIATITSPVAFAEATRLAVRKGLGSDRKEAAQLRIRAEKEERAKLRAINQARAQARARAPRGPESPQADVHEAAVSVAARRMEGENIAQTARFGENILREPDEVITNFPLYEQPVLTSPVQQKAINVAKKVLIERGIEPNAVAPNRVFQTVVDLLNTDNNFSVRLFAEAEAAGFSKADFLNAFRTTASEAGRTLQNLSRFYDGFRTRALKGDKAAAAILKEMDDAARQARASGRSPYGPRVNALEAADTAMAKASRLFRKLIISLPATATRNFIDANSRLIIQATNQALDQTLARVFTPRSAELEPIGDSFDQLGRVYGSIYKDVAATVDELTVRKGLKPSRTRQEIDRLVDAFPELRNRAFASLEADLDIQRRAASGTLVDKVEAGVDGWLLAMNRTQEFVIRRAVLTNRLDQELRKVGSSLEEVVDDGVIPAGMEQALTNSIDQALKMTFALPPRGNQGMARFFRAYGEIIESSRVLAFLEPFPRFLFNLTQFITENMPTGGMRLVRPINRAKLAEGDFDPLARELTSSALLATAFAIRQGEFPGLTPGAAYDEVLTKDGNRASLAPFATMIPYLFIADFVMRLDEGRTQPNDEFFREMRRGLTSSAPQLGRVTASIEEAIKGLAEIKTTGDLQKLGEFGGEVATGFMRPLQLIRDFREEYNEAVALQRETRGRGFMGPIENMLVPENLPPRESLVGADEIRSPRVRLPGGRTLGAGLTSQLSGLRVKQKRTLGEKELERLGFGAKQLSPKTGDKRLDALVARYQRPVFRTIANRVLKTDIYKELPTRTQQEILRGILNGSRRVGLVVSQQLVPGAAVQRALKRLPGTELAMAEELIDTIMINEGSDFRFRQVLEALETVAVENFKRQGL